MILGLTRISDRCGKKYEHFSKDNKLPYNAIQPIRRNALGVIMHAGLLMDLCPKCMNEFEKFMTVNSKEESNNDQN